MHFSFLSLKATIIYMKVILTIAVFSVNESVCNFSSELIKHFICKPVFYTLTLYKKVINQMESHSLWNSLKFCSHLYSENLNILLELWEIEGLMAISQFSCGGGRCFLGGVH